MTDLNKLNDLAAKLVEKAANAHDSGDAMRFAQAATNVTNACITIASINREAPPAATPDVKKMVNRFLAWKLPPDFNPDGGITFEKTGNASSPAHMRFMRQPVGTNLLTATQAEDMIRYMLAD